MQIILALIIISLLIAGGFLVAFFWAVKDGQYDDDYTPSIRLLIDDDMIPIEQQNETSGSNSSTNSQSRSDAPTRTL